MPTAFFERLSRALTEGLVRATAYAQVSAPENDFSSFVEYATLLHFYIFSKGERHIAGRFRKSGEDAHFGGEGNHALMGADPSEIESGLREAWAFLRTCDPRSQPKWTVATHLAEFLERFFRVHPFVDGNGRVGRLILVATVAQSGRWKLEFPKGSKNRRKYLCALQQAHRDAVGSTHPFHRTGRRQPAWALARFLHNAITDVPIDFEAEPPPK